ncbi:MAG: hypothetical protein ACSHWT_09270 [Glaciecola sp.]
MNTLKNIYRKFGQLKNRVISYVKYKKNKKYNSSGIEIKTEKSGEVKIVYADESHIMTTFFDINPVSPCGRFLVVTHVPFIDRIPFLGEICTIKVIDLNNYNIIYTTTTEAWGSQLGANVQWGINSETLHYNVIKNEKIIGITKNITTNETIELKNAIYCIDIKNNISYSPYIEYFNSMIYGYSAPEKNPITTSNQKKENKAIYISCLKTGELIEKIFLDDIINKIRTQEKINYICPNIFHIKINTASDKIFFVLHSYNSVLKISPRKQLILYDIKSYTFKVIVSAKEWDNGGHHPSWINERMILMNLKIDKKMRFVSIDTVTLEKTILSKKILGGGHPTLVNNKRIITDAYVSEPFVNSKKHVALRDIDINNDTEKVISYVNTNRVSGDCRIDPHPYILKNKNIVIWNGIHKGYRAVFIGKYL